MTVYAGAHHSFDSVSLPVMRLPHVDNAAGCRLRLASLLGPYPPEREFSHCLRSGATVGWSAEATERARRNVRAQLAGLLR